MARTEGQWQKGLSLITPSENVPILLRNTYLNFGGELIGETGYGFRDNGGVMQVKDSGGSWANFGAGGGSITVETPVGTVDSANVTFTVTATPKWIVSDGITYFSGFGYSIAALTVTMEVPPSQFIRAII